MLVDEVRKDPIENMEKPMNEDVKSFLEQQKDREDLSNEINVSLNLLFDEKLSFDLTTKNNFDREKRSKTHRFRLLPAFQQIRCCHNRRPIEILRDN